MKEALGSMGRIDVNVVILAITFAGIAIGFLALNASINSNINAATAEIRAEMQALRSETQADNAEVRAEIKALRSEVRAEIQALRSEMQANDAEIRAEIKALRSEMQANDAELRAEMQAVRESLDSRLDGIEVEQARMSGELNVLRAAAPDGAPDAP